MDEHHTDKAPPTFQPEFATMFTSSGLAVVQGLVTSWDAIGEARGLSLHNDAVHLNNKGGKLLTDMLGDWVESMQEEIVLQHQFSTFPITSPEPSPATVAVKGKDEEEKERKATVVQA